MGFLISINGADFTPYNNDLKPAYDLSVKKTKKVLSKNNVGDNKQSPNSKDKFQADLETALSAFKLRKYQEQENQIGPQSNHPKTAKDIMTTEIVSINFSEKISSAFEMMTSNQIRHLPVFNDEEKVCGIISDKDLLINWTDIKSPLHQQKQIGDIMSQNLIVATETTLLSELAATMLQQKIACLPIIDEKIELIGIVTSTDLLEVITHLPQLNLWA